MSLKTYARKGRSLIVKMEPQGKVAKRLLVGSYELALKFAGRYQKRKRSILKVIESHADETILANPKLLKREYREIMYCRFMYGIAAKEYYVYDFQNLSHTGRQLYVTRGNKYRYYRMANNPNYISFLNMKTETWRKFGPYYGREVLPLYDENDKAALEDFLSRHSRFIYKPADDYGGKGIKIYDSADFDSLDDLMHVLLYRGYCVIEELIIQADPIASLHPASVNTLRVVAFRHPDGKAEIQWCFMRMGMEGSHTDNMSSGGMAVIVDPETGIAATTGRDWLGRMHTYHPDTGVQLVGFKIPAWDQAQALVQELSGVLPQVRFVGWDLAYTDKGWIFVEGNARPQCVTVQITEYNGKLHLLKALEESLLKEGAESCETS